MNDIIEFSSLTIRKSHKLQLPQRRLRDTTITGKNDQTIQQFLHKHQYCSKLRKNRKMKILCRTRAVKFLRS